MTTQLSERITYKGEEYGVSSTPLEPYFESSNDRPDFATKPTYLRRRYVGSWEIVEHRLYLVGIDASLRDGSEVSLETIFPGFPDRVFAHWFTGTLEIHDGNALRRDGFVTIFERDLLVTFDRGVLVHEEVRDNRDEAFQEDEE